VTDTLQIMQDRIMSSHRTHYTVRQPDDQTLPEAIPVEALTGDSLLMARLASETNFASEVLNSSAEDCWNDL